MRAGLNKWWLLPFGILVASVVVALSIVVLQPTLTDRLTAEVAQQTTNETTQTTAETATANCSGAPVADDACYQGHHQEAVIEPDGRREVASADCSDALASDYLCYQQRLGDLVRTNGVEATFAALKSEMAGNEFVRSNCHQMVHVIGRAAAELYGDLLSTYGQGDNFCGSGYYHGAMETIVAKIGPDELLDKANTLCADLGGRQEYSFYRYNCTHGLGHGFMGVQENELFESLRTCDTLTDSWESNRCYGGVFMENVIAKDNPNHPSKYLKADQPLYPCNVVGNRYKNECYERQTLYALQTHGNDFSKVFNL